MPRATKSSLVDHRFPAFYACYLLKSVRTPKATATYIGSTPSPPRRIRQHNGIISQGAWKTKHNRPWVMQMIVHGFPSKLAALQFEWAWQHPHISRHLRDNDGQAVFTHSAKFKYLTTNVKVARSMVSSHPYNTWPLNVKIFTEEAEKAWLNAGKVQEMPPLPLGVKVVTELEGVDGQTGKLGSGRTGPIDVSDAQFTTEHLRKASSIFVPDRDLRCSICRDAIQHDGDPLATALCPTASCTAVSHLSCLSRHFLANEASSSSSSDIIPRGGYCSSCNGYVLWGDVVRGCYRRREGGATPEAEQDDADEQDEGEDLRGQLFGDQREDEDEAALPKPARSVTSRRTIKQSKARGAAPSVSKPAQLSTLASCSSSDEREHFDLDNISGDSSDEQDSGDGRPQWHSILPPKSAPSRQGSVPPRATPVYPRPRLRDSEDHRGAPTSSHAPASHGRPQTQTAVGAEEPSRGKMCHGGVSRDPARTTSRKPRSADMAGTHAVDPLLSTPGDAARRGVPDRGSSCPPSGTTPGDGRRPLEIARAALGKPSLQPFPDMPPLSPPRPEMDDRRPGRKVFDNEVVEISSD
ncbi:hypothetical protein V8D89_000261 [Ganoderma adspersum]